MDFHELDWKEIRNQLIPFHSQCNNTVRISQEEIDATLQAIREKRGLWELSEQINEQWWGAIRDSIMSKQKCRINVKQDEAHE